MPSLSLTPFLLSRFICLPGTALIKCSPPELMTESGLVVKPEAAAEWEREQKAVRMGEVVQIDKAVKGTGLFTRQSKVVELVNDADTRAIKRGSTVYYLGRQDEANDEYVVVKIGQIVGVRQ
jgi:hypothetical protein